MSAPEFGSLGWFWYRLRRSPRRAVVDFLMWSCHPTKEGRMPRIHKTLFRILVDKEAMRREFLAHPQMAENMRRGREDSAAGRVFPYRPPQR